MGKMDFNAMQTPKIPVLLHFDLMKAGTLQFLSVCERKYLATARIAQRPAGIDGQRGGNENKERGGLDEEDEERRFTYPRQGTGHGSLLRPPLSIELECRFP
jgi:hypothetical protein